MSLRQRHRGELPSVPTDFVGRDVDLARIGELLTGGERLITLVGPGGMGKTRLAAEAIHHHLGPRGRPVYWARLARLPHGADLEAVTEETVQSIAKADIAGRSAWEVLVDIVTRTSTEEQEQRAVLVLDNCEHVLAAVAVLIDDLLGAAPELTILATSREPVGWVDERLYPVPPLAADDAQTLFRQRAELTGRLVAESAEEADIVAGICRHVDDNPLFIRLAAARLRHQSPIMVLRALSGDLDDERIRWSHGPRLGVDARHHGVLDVVGWSYRLCDDAERLLLQRMSVFATGYEAEASVAVRTGADADAIAAVCADDPETIESRQGSGDAVILAEDVEDLLERLVERSLVSAHITATAVRYYLLESVRVYTRDQLRSRDEDEAGLLARRHRRYYRDQVLAGRTTPYGPQEQAWLDWARAAWDNILTAIETGLTDPDEALLGLEMATVLMALRVQFVRGANQSITRLTERALHATGDPGAAPTELRVTAMSLIAWIALWQSRSGYANQLLDQCAEDFLSDPELRRTWRDRAEEDLGLPPTMEFGWAMELLLVRMDPRAIPIFLRTQRKFAEAGDMGGVERSELFETFAHALFGPPERSLDAADALLDRARRSGGAWAVAWAEAAWVIAQTIHGDPYRALEVERDALERGLDSGDTWTSSWLLGFRITTLTMIITKKMESGEADRGELVELATEAAHLLGGVQRQRSSMGIDVSGVTVIAMHVRWSEQVVASVLGEHTYAATYQRGSRLRPEYDELQRFILGLHSSGEQRPGDAATRWDDLSTTEREVAVLAAAGWSNRAIAERRVTSTRTVDAQLAAIRQKLEISSRNEIVRHIPAELLDTVRQESDEWSARSAENRKR